MYFLVGLIVDNNLFLSNHGLLDASGGGAYVHNLFKGSVTVWTDNLLPRHTPFFEAHSTVVTGPEGANTLAEKIYGITVDQNDDRFYNNLILSKNFLLPYEENNYKVKANGNVYLSKSKPLAQEANAIVINDFKSGLKLEKKADGWWLEMNTDPAWQETSRILITTELLGRSSVTSSLFENSEGLPYIIDTDYFGGKRNENNLSAGPLSDVSTGKVSVKVWPRGK